MHTYFVVLEIHLDLFEVCALQSFVVIKIDVFCASIVTKCLYRAVTGKQDRCGNSVEGVVERQQVGALLRAVSNNGVCNRAVGRAKVDGRYIVRRHAKACFFSRNPFCNLAAIGRLSHFSYRSHAWRSVRPQKLVLAVRSPFIKAIATTQ